MNNVILPELGEGIKQATVACWHTAVGRRVEKDDDIVELVTDKASFNVAAGVSGIVKEIYFNGGQKANIGDILAVIEPARKGEKE
jgi:2-oxoisovalerate dehydrogenase E2 component (dihydrolipoyl transacylase)